MKTPEGQIFGPVAKTEMDHWLAEGRVSAECTLRTDNAPEWRPADEYYGELTPHNQGPTSSGSPFAGSGGRPAIGQVAAAQPDAARRQAQSGSYMVPHRGGLILVLGILGWVFTCPIFSVMAWVMGSSDLREMRGGRMDDSGKGLTQAGHILGMIYSLLWIAFFVIMLFVFVFAAVAGALG